jgi:hypothetical protein
LSIAKSKENQPKAEKTIDEKVEVKTLNSKVWDIDYDEDFN